MRSIRMHLGKKCMKKCIGREISLRVLKMLRILASQSIPSWNQIIAWLREMETLRRGAA